MLLHWAKKYAILYTKPRLKIMYESVIRQIYNTKRAYFHRSECCNPSRMTNCNISLKCYNRCHPCCRNVTPLGKKVGDIEYQTTPKIVLKKSIFFKGFEVEFKNCLEILSKIKMTLY